MTDKNTQNSSKGNSGKNTDDVEKHEPPHTTKGGITAPKFGAAGSGGAENEPVPEQHDREDESR